jgi:hypothetical protein
MADRPKTTQARKAKLKMRFKGPRLSDEIRKTQEKLDLLREIELEQELG